MSCVSPSPCSCSRCISVARKAEPVFSGVMRYFPRTLRAVSRVSFKGNEKHNPGEPLHWSKDKSGDHPDCVARHNITPYEVDPDSGERHIVNGAWRQLAWCEIALEATERGLCTWDDLESGRVTIKELGVRLAAGTAP